MNLYAYVGGDPVNWIDPWGLKWLFIGWRTDHIPDLILFNRAWRTTETLYAICKQDDECESPETREIKVTSRCHSPIPGQSRNWGNVGAESNGGVNATFDLGYAARRAYTHGSKSHIEYSKKNGQQHCDKLKDNPSLGEVWTTAP